MHSSLHCSCKIVYNALLFPATLADVFFLLSALLGNMIFLLLNTILGYTAFWLGNVWYIQWFLTAAMYVFGGEMVPFWFLPDKLNIITWFMPFRCVLFIPMEMYLGRLSMNQIISIFVTSTVAPRFVAFGTLCVVSGTKENRSSGRLTRKEVRNVLSILGKTIYSHTVAVSKRVSLFIHYGYLGSRYKLCVSVSGFVSFGFKVWISQRMEFSRITSDLFFLTIHIRNRFNIYT